MSQAPLQSDPPPSESRIAFQFGILSMLLLTALVAMVLGITMLAPGLGIALTILLIPAFLWTARASGRARGMGRPMDAAAKVAFFASTVGILLATILAAGIAFYATCWVGFLGGAGIGSLVEKGDYAGLGVGLVAGGILGTVSALAVMVFLLVRLLPRWNAEKNPPPAPAEASPPPSDPENTG